MLGRRRTPYGLPYRTATGLITIGSYPDKPVTEHFNMTGHSSDDLSMMVIEQIMAGSARRKQRESFWIHTLQTLAPDGLNLDP